MPKSQFLSGDFPINSPVVVEYEALEGDIIYIGDGFNMLKCILADQNVKELFQSGKVKIGTRLFLNYFSIMDNSERTNCFDGIFNLFFNSVTCANGLALGLQKYYLKTKLKGRLNDSTQ